MHVGLAALLTLGMCVFLPIGLLAAVVFLAMHRSRDRHAERMAMIDRGMAPSPRRERDPVRSVGWAAGLVVGGVLWMVSDTFDLSGFGILLTAVGVAYLTRGVLGLSRERMPSPREGIGEGGKP
jgi:hypothetical protein